MKFCIVMRAFSAVCFVVAAVLAVIAFNIGETAPGFTLSISAVAFALNVVVWHLNLSTERTLRRTDRLLAEQGR